MKKRERIKYLAKNEFEKKFGVKTVEISGALDCVISMNKYIKTVDCKRKAFELYFGSITREVTINTSCGINECIKKEHLTYTYKPFKKNQDYIKTYLKLDGSEVLAHRLGISEGILVNYLENSSQAI